MKLDDNLTDVKGVGGELLKKFQALKINNIHQLIEYFPRRYDDFSQVQSISDIKPGFVTLRVSLSQATGRYSRRGLHITEAVASDDTGSVRLIWFNQPYRAKAIKAGREYFVSGEYGLNRQKFSIINPSAELVSDFPLNTARIVPIYRETKGLKSNQIRKIIKNTLSQIRNMPESLPDWLVSKLALPSRSLALEKIHFPDSTKSLEAAKKRLGFEEVFQLSLASLLNKQQIHQDKAVVIKFNQELARSFVAGLPFKLTDAQRRSIWQIYQDMESSQPMNRLLEGDVGSGKTVVAAMAGLMAMGNGYQVAFMSPTEVLARQHAGTISSLFESLGMRGEISLLTGSVKEQQKQLLRSKIAAGQTKFIIGTHALITENVDMHNLGLVIIDEQHRFGVEERKKLLAKAGHAPHVLTLTATPIPRSLALTLYGELDISIIDTTPHSRQAVITRLVNPNDRQKLYQKIADNLQDDNQVFVVCPLISESESMDLRSAERVYQELKTKYFKSYNLGLLHGKMKPEEKEKVMEQFVAGNVTVLVATTVIEVGVNVPNATTMVIENPERFGLAQIHQLRGRIGRSGQGGTCYLVLSESDKPNRRLRSLASLNDGFKLAELDLEIRGPGAIYGTMQHGQLDLRIAKLTDIKLINLAREAANEFIDRNDKLINYKHLSDRVEYLRKITNLN